MLQTQWLEALSVEMNKVNCFGEVFGNLPTALY